MIGPKVPEYDDPNYYLKKASERMALYCSQTTWHGMQFLIVENNPNPMKRLIWVAIMTAAFGCICIFMQQAIIDYLKSGTVTTLELSG